MTQSTTAFDMDKLYDILATCTVQLRKGDEIVKESTPGLDVTHVYAMPHESEARPHIEKVDLHFITIGVDKALAESRKAELIDILNAYPEPDRIAAGPSYIEVGGVIGDQGAAFQLFALGTVLGLWGVITPKMLGATGDQADQLAGSGYIMISGYRRKDAGGNQGAMEPAQATSASEAPEKTDG